MADQPAAIAVLHQPGIAVGSLHALAARPAQYERRIATAIEKQQGLRTAGERVGHGVDKRRR